jgi:hypothetical protein
MVIVGMIPHRYIYRRGSSRLRSTAVGSTAPTGIVGNDHNVIWCQCNNGWDGDCLFDNAGVLIVDGNGDPA